MNIDPVRAHVEILKFVKVKKAELKEMEEASRAAVEEALGGNEVGEVCGETVVTWKRVMSKRLNQQALKSDHPELVEQYSQLGESRRFEVVS